MPNKFPFRNLAFQGGGVKTFVYHGALRVLEAEGILPQIERVGGTSAGALLAVLLSFRLSVDEIVALLQTVDYSLIAKPGRERRWPHQTPKLIEHELDRVMGSLDALGRMVRHYGWYSHSYAHGWLEETIATYCQGNARATFADFERLGFLKPYVVATNLSTHSVQVFSVDTTPDAPVADTVVLSASIPLYFEAPRFDGLQLGNGDYYADGSVLLNFPLEIFDTPRYETGNRHFMYGLNWETLGCRHYTPKDCPQRNRPIGTIIQYATNLFETLAEAQNVAYENDLSDQFRTINISNCGVSATDFEIRPEAGNTTYQELVQAGEKAAREYLENYRLPTDRLYDVKAKFAEFLQNWRPEMPRRRPSS